MNTALYCWRRGQQGRAEGQSASEPPCLGTERYYAIGTETALSCLQFQESPSGGLEPAAESLGQGKVGFWLLVLDRVSLSSWGCKPHNQSSLLPAPAAQTPSPQFPHPPRTTLGIKAPECFLLSGIPQDHHHHRHPTACLQAPVLFGQ